MTSLASLSDSHCHLNLNQFDNDLEKVLERAFAAGVDRIMIPGLDVATSQRALQIADNFPNLYAAVGVHPNSADSWDSDTIKKIKDLCQHPKVRAVGEIGLDYYRQHSAPETQKEIFLTQLDLAAELHLPVVIHNRESFDDLMEILKAWRAKLSEEGSDLADRPGVLHAFEGTHEAAAKAITQGFLLGFGGPVTYSKATSRQEILNDVALNNIIIETDSPFLAPHPFRGSRNEPANVKLVVEKIAEIINLSYEEVASITTRSADRLFLWRAPS